EPAARLERRATSGRSVAVAAVAPPLPPPRPPGLAVSWTLQAPPVALGGRVLGVRPPPPPIAGLNFTAPPPPGPPPKVAVPASPPVRTSPVVESRPEASLPPPATREEEEAPAAEEVLTSEPPASGPLSYRLTPTGDALVDLHGLPVEVAKVAVQVALEDMMLGPAPGMGSGSSDIGDLIIVTGVGKHSPGGIAMIRPAVIAFLRDELRLAVLETRRDGPGRLRVPAEELRRLRGVPMPS
ncbi:unnamed protein product, partial [Polarella glacialis]